MPSLTRRLRSWINGVLGASKQMTPLASSTQAIDLSEHEVVYTMVPYDENLLERSRTQWQFGDWESLAAMPRETMQHHPDRAKLALLAAAGHLQQGNNQAARQFTRLAQDWGCSKKLVSQILIAGVHNSLGRAAATVGLQTRSLHHFEASIAIGSPGSDQRLLAQARITEQHTQLDLNANGLESKERVGGTGVNTSISASSGNSGVETFELALKQHKADLDVQLKKQADSIIGVRKSLDASLRKEVANATKQIEAAIGLQSYFATGELLNINTERHRWPISPDFSLFLIELIETHDYDLIIEFGSGISTVIIAKAIAKTAKRSSGKEPTALISFEHLEKYFQQSLAMLKQAGMAEKVRLELTPLEPYMAPNGNIYPYYSCHALLAALAQQHPRPGTRILVLVDGPPAATGKHARYPAAPSILKFFSGANLSFLLDDYIRDDEKEIAALWEAEFAAAGLTYTTTVRKLEKDACLITVAAVATPSEGIL
jgi:predicted O-methyltransferase YrrM